MTRDFETAVNILTEKAKASENKEPKVLDAEGTAMAEKKRFTFDIIDTPADPLR